MTCQHRPALEPKPLRANMQTCNRPITNFATIQRLRLDNIGNQPMWTHTCQQQRPQWVRCTHTYTRQLTHANQLAMSQFL